MDQGEHDYDAVIPTCNDLILVSCFSMAAVTATTVRCCSDCPPMKFRLHYTVTHKSTNRNVRDQFGLG
jgi:hypothetical protein